MLSDSSDRRGRTTSCCVFAAGRRVFGFSAAKARAFFTASSKQFLQQYAEAIAGRARISSARCFPAWLRPHSSPMVPRSKASVRQLLSLVFFLKAAHAFLSPFLGRSVP